MKKHGEFRVLGKFPGADYIGQYGNERVYNRFTRCRMFPFKEDFLSGKTVYVAKYKCGDRIEEELMFSNRFRMHVPVKYPYMQASAEQVDQFVRDWNTVTLASRRHHLLLIQGLDKSLNGQLVEYLYHNHSCVDVRLPDGAVKTVEPRYLRAVYFTFFTTFIF